MKRQASGSALASEQRIPQAQFKLGSLYMNGQGLPRDYEYAYGWFSVAAQYQHKKSIDALPGAMEKLSAEELEEAKKLSMDFIARYGPREDDPKGPKEINNE